MASAGTPPLGRERSVFKVFQSWEKEEITGGYRAGERPLAAHSQTG